MLYIEKKGLSSDLYQEIIKIRKSNEWKSIERDNTKSIRQVFDNQFPKNDVKKVLICEQKGLCAYCMRRIRMDSHSRIEHFIPLSADKEKAIDYMNMLGVCDGGEKFTGQQGHVLCCDAYKKEKAISISPLNKIQMDKIAYKADGIIYTVPEDEAMEEDINEKLLLNGIKKADGTIRDTSTELLKGRRDTYERARRMMEQLNRKRKCTSVTVKKLIDSLYSEEEREEYAEVKLYYFRKKYNSLVKQGM